MKGLKKGGYIGKVAARLFHTLSSELINIKSVSHLGIELSESSECFCLTQTLHTEIPLLPIGTRKCQPISYDYIFYLYLFFFSLRNKCMTEICYKSTQVMVHEAPQLQIIPVGSLQCSHAKKKTLLTCSPCWNYCGVSKSSVKEIFHFSRMRPGYNDFWRVEIVGHSVLHVCSLTYHCPG